MKRRSVHGVIQPLKIVVNGQLVEYGFSIMYIIAGALLGAPAGQEFTAAVSAATEVKAPDAHACRLSSSLGLSFVPSSHKLLLMQFQGVDAFSLHVGRGRNHAGRSLSNSDLETVATGGNELGLQQGFDRRCVVLPDI